MRGSGKSTIGPFLAKKLKRQFLEVDDLICAKANKKVSEIIKNDGWSKFRAYESSIISDISHTLDNAVIATGGGVISNKDNIINLKNNGGILILLTCSIETIIKRIGNDTNRPLLTNANTFEEDLKIVFIERKSLYKSFADVIISSDGNNPSETVENIIRALKQRNTI